MNTGATFLFIARILNICCFHAAVNFFGRQFAEFALFKIWKTHSKGIIADNKENEPLIASDGSQFSTSFK